MTKKTTRRQQSSEKDGILYLAFELSKSTWKLGFSIGLGQRVRERNVAAGQIEKLLGEIDSAKRRFQASKWTGGHGAPNQTVWMCRN
jgi:hypothetical protein